MYSFSASLLHSVIILVVVVEVVVLNFLPYLQFLTILYWDFTRGWEWEKVMILSDSFGYFSFTLIVLFVQYCSAKCIFCISYWLELLSSLCVFRRLSWSYIQGSFYKWFYLDLHVPPLFQFSDKVKVFVNLFGFFFFNLWSAGSAQPTRRKILFFFPFLFPRFCCLPVWLYVANAVHCYCKSSFFTFLNVILNLCIDASRLFKIPVSPLPSWYI